MNSIDPFLRQEIKSLQKQHIDTIITYLYYSIGSEVFQNEHNTTCDQFITTWIFWCKNGRYLAKQVDCRREISEQPIRSISSKPFEFFTLNKSLILANRNLQKGQFYPPIPVHHYGEEMVILINKEINFIDIAETQRTENIWSKYEWVEPSIQLIDLTVNEIK